MKRGAIPKDRQATIDEYKKMEEKKGNIERHRQLLERAKKAQKEINEIKHVLSELEELKRGRTENLPDWVREPLQMGVKPETLGVRLDEDYLNKKEEELEKIKKKKERELRKILKEIK